MARGRFVSKAISLDEKVDALSSDTVRLLFTWLITHLDCEGRMYGDAQTVKSIVFPRRSMKAQTIEKYLVELEHQGLILRYSAPGGHYLLMKNFEKHQPGLRKDKESASQIPPFTPELGRSKDGVGLTQVKVKDKTKDKVKDKEETKQEESLVQSFNSESKIKKAIEFYQENILLGATVSEDVEEEIKIACGRYSPWWVVDAIREACRANHPDWGYIGGILKHWSKYGKKAGKPISH